MKTTIKSNQLLIALLLFTSFISCSDDEVTESTAEVQADEEPSEPQPEPNDEGDPEESYKLHRVFSSISVGVPVLMVSPPDGSNRNFVVDKNGLVTRFDNQDSVKMSSTFLDIRSVVDPTLEQGLLGLAFDPDYVKNGYFYLFYTVNVKGVRSSVLSRMSVSTTDPNLADVSTELKIMEIARPADLHAGGMVLFGQDRLLYVSVGDGSVDPKIAQDTTSLLGKILRIDVSGSNAKTPYSIPADNPFVGSKAGQREEIFAFGFRNPWRMSLDEETGQIWIGDVGESSYEEVNILVPGGNYGWPHYEGSTEYLDAQDLSYSDTQAPYYEYAHTSGKGSVIGGHVYRGNNLKGLLGKYLFADFVSGEIFILDDSKQPFSTTLLGQISLPTAFGEDSNRELYIVNTVGEIYRIDSN